MPGKLRRTVLESGKLLEQSFFVTKYGKENFGGGSFSLFGIEFHQVIHFGRHIGKKQIYKSESTHGFHHDNGSWNNDRIMAAFNFQSEGLFVLGDRLLGLGNGGSGLDAGTDKDGASVT